MVANPEQEAFFQVIARHQSGASENDIRTAFQRFVETAGIAELSEMSTEVPPGVGNRGSMDLYVHNTCFEFKKDILRQGQPKPEDIAQLDGYIASLLRAGSGVRNGVLTDGVNYFLRRVGAADRPASAQYEFSSPEQAPRLREFLYGVIAAPAANISPTAENLARQFGSDSDAFRACNLLLQQAYAAHRQDATVAVKRRLWQDLLQVALGKDAAAAGDASDDLFLRHTYITSLTAAIMQQRLLGDAARHAAENPDAFLKGHILAEQSNIRGVVDADLFTWAVEVGENAYLQHIARVVERFDWTRNAAEVAPTLYQQIIPPEERKRLGEYYTPRWLAQEITAAVVDDPLRQRALDPACGSGTFIETAAERILAHAAAAGLSTPETLRKLQDNIIGIDIHPVAVQLSKATWVMAAATTILAARGAGADAGAVSAPVYLGDAMQLRYNTGTLAAGQSITLDTGETLPGHMAPVIFSIPKELARRQADIDRIISAMAAAIDEGQDAERIADAYPMSDQCRQSLKDVAVTMRNLHAADRNHVWAYYIRNMIRPAVIAEAKVDRIIGNPPWLTYGQSADIIRAELRAMSESRYQIWAGGKLAPHQDIATLFYTRCADLYAKPGAQIGMVLPHSVLRAGQHLKWRGGAYRPKGQRSAAGIGLNFRIREPWDLDNVIPDFFPMPASVVFAECRGAGPGAPLAPGTVLVWRGDWRQNCAGISKRSETLHHDDGKFRSPYAALSRQGPTITDRQLFFVDTLPHTAMLPAANATSVRPRQGKLDKVKYAAAQLRQLEGVVSNDHLFDVYRGDCFAPYVALEPLKAALPAHRPTMTLPLRHDDCGGDKHSACRLDAAALHSSMQRRWNNVSAMFTAMHPNQAIKDLYHRLNHLNKLTRQLEYLRGAIAGNGTVRIAYTQSGQPTAAFIRDNYAIADRSLYQTICRSEAEGHYILAVINSDALAAQAKPFCPTNWAKKIRSFEKHGWKLPIPRYDAGDPRHIKLSALGQAAGLECAALIADSDIPTRPAGDPQSRAARKLLRHQWQPHSAVAQDIEAAVSQLLSDPAQAALAQRQMSDK